MLLARNQGEFAAAKYSAATGSGGSAMFRTLVIDDQEPSRRQLCQLLEGTGFDVVAARGAQEGIRTAVAGEFDLILLDLVLSDDSGEHVLHAVLSARPEARIVIVSEVTDAGRRAGALDMGAVDFVQKPYCEAELLARVRARLRANEPHPVVEGSVSWGRRNPLAAIPGDRAGGEAHAKDAPPASVVDLRGDRPPFGGVNRTRPVLGSRAAAQSGITTAPRFAVAADGTPAGDSEFRVDMLRRAMYVNGRCVELSQREFLLLCYLLRHRGQICTRQELLAEVWGIQFEAQTNVVDVYIRRLRLKLAIDTIDTIRKVGYRLSVA